MRKSLLRASLVGACLPLVAGIGAMTVPVAANARAVCHYASPYACKTNEERPCGRVEQWSEGVRVRSRVFARGYGCDVARKVIGNDGPPAGAWHAGYGSGEGGVYVEDSSGYFGPKLLWKRYVRYSNVLRQSEIPPHSCGNNPLWMWVSDVRVKGVACMTAFRITKRHGKAGYPCWSKGVCKIEGFRCVDKGGRENWSRHECRRGKQVIRFVNGG